MTVTVNNVDTSLKKTVSNLPDSSPVPKISKPLSTPNPTGSKTYVPSRKRNLSNSPPAATDKNSENSQSTAPTVLAKKVKESDSEVAQPETDTNSVNRIQPLVDSSISNSQNSSLADTHSTIADSNKHDTTKTDSTHLAPTDVKNKNDSIPSATAPKKKTIVKTKTVKRIIRRKINKDGVVIETKEIVPIETEPKQDHQVSKIIFNLKFSDQGFHLS